MARTGELPVYLWDFGIQVLFRLFDLLTVTGCCQVRFPLVAARPGRGRRRHLIVIAWRPSVAGGSACLAKLCRSRPTEDLSSPVAVVVVLRSCA